MFSRFSVVGTSGLVGALDLMDKLYLFIFYISI